MIKHQSTGTTFTPTQGKYFNMVNKPNFNRYQLTKVTYTTNHALSLCINYRVFFRWDKNWFKTGHQLKIAKHEFHNTYLTYFFCGGMSENVALFTAIKKVWSRSPQWRRLMKSRADTSPPAASAAILYEISVFSSTTSKVCIDKTKIMC